MTPSMDALPANRTWQPPCSHGTYQHEAITSRSRQLLMIGTWSPETCWATIRREIKNTKSDIQLVFFLSTLNYDARSTTRHIHKFAISHNTSAREGQIRRLFHSPNKARSAVSPPSLPTPVLQYSDVPPQSTQPDDKQDLSLGNVEVNLLVSNVWTHFIFESCTISISLYCQTPHCISQ